MTRKRLLLAAVLAAAAGVAYLAIKAAATAYMDTRLQDGDWPETNRPSPAYGCSASSKGGVS